MQPEDNEAYILTGTRKCVEPRLLQYHFQQYTRDCNLKNVTFHTLRHTFATRCVEAGFDSKALSEILGHRDVKTTLNLYVHPSFDFKKENMEKLAHPLVG
jgi:integrase